VYVNFRLQLYLIWFTIASFPWCPLKRVSPDPFCATRCNIMNRTGFPIQVNDGIMGGLAAIVSVPIWTKQEVKCAAICWLNSTDIKKNTFRCMSHMTWMNILHFHGNDCNTIPGRKQDTPLPHFFWLRYNQLLLYWCLLENHPIKQTRTDHFFNGKVNDLNLSTMFETDSTGH
jgi:hypothetical protein